MGTINYRRFSCNVVTIVFILFLGMKTPLQAQQNCSFPQRRTFSVEDNKIRIYTPEVEDTVKLLVASDTHLWMSDERENDFQKFSKRMSDAYHVTRHYDTKEDTNPEKAFLETISKASNLKVDAIALLGDIFSYPSEAAIEWAAKNLNDSGIPYYYVCGNHDWHYEGMPGPLKDLRQKWINNRLLKMFHGNDPMKYFVDLKGMRLLFIDNSTYEISYEQLMFLQQQIETKKPLIVMMHIPLYATGRNVGFGCAHPDWKSSNDHSFELEKREPWPRDGHSPVTFKFREEIINAPNVLAVFAGHIHKQSLDVMEGVPQFVTQYNACGAFYDVVIIPQRAISVK
jgi:predicted phosphodiesterase